MAPPNTPPNSSTSSRWPKRRCRDCRPSPRSGAGGGCGSCRRLGRRTNATTTPRRAGGRASAGGGGGGGRGLGSSSGPRNTRASPAERAGGEQRRMLTVFHRQGDPTRHAGGSELLFAPTERGEDPRHVGTIEPLWNL